MNYKNLIKIALAFLPVCILLTCFFVSKSHESDLLIYNPYTEEMLVKIDDEEFSVKPKQELKIKLDMGKHHVYSYCGKVLINSYINVDSNIYLKGGLLNLSNQPVYVWTKIYGTPSSQEIYRELTNDDTITIEDPYKNLDQNIIYIDSMKIIGPVVEYPNTKLLLEKRWLYSINQPFENKIHDSDGKNIGVRKEISKLFSREELFNYYVELVNEL